MQRIRDLEGVRAQARGWCSPGLNAFHGDSAAVILRDGTFACGVEEERLNRIKHWAGFPAAAVGAVLSELAVLRGGTRAREPMRRLQFYLKL